MKPIRLRAPLPRHSSPRSTDCFLISDAKLLCGDLCILLRHYEFVRVKLPVVEIKTFL